MVRALTAFFLLIFLSWNASGQLLRSEPRLKTGFSTLRQQSVKSTQNKPPALAIHAFGG